MAVLKDLIVHGNSRFINGAQFNTINAKSIGADAGIFNKLIATNLEASEATIDNLTAQHATVVGLLDVQGELHTNSWTNANIANIGGSFYISPTVEPTDGTTTISITRNSATSWTVSASGTFATDFIKSGTATLGVAWPANSLVLITGDIVINDMVYPLGTLKGTLNAQVDATAATTSKKITITGVTDAQNNSSPSVLQELYELNNSANISNATFKNGKISLYKLGSNPIGILLTSMGTSSNSLMDIYGGVSTTPNVRIGHLGGLSSYTDSAGNTRTPTGWGIYTDNGYFKGVVVADSGSIGKFTINSKAIYSDAHSAWNTGSQGIFIGTNDTNYYISGGSGASWWIRDDGRFQFGGTNGITYNGTTLSVPAANVSGKLTAATIDGTQITANTITAGQIASSAITADELAANAVTSTKIKAGEVKADNIATNAVTADKIQASAVTADKLDATTINASKKLTVGAMTDAAANSILNSELEIGGRNLLRFTAKPTYTGNLNTGWSVWSGTVTTTEEGIKVTNSSSVASFRVPLIYQNAVVGGEEVTLSFEYRTSLTTTAITVYLICTSGSNKNTTVTLPAVSTTEWNKCNATITFSSTEGQITDSILIPYQTGWFEIKNATLKLEKGNKATDWSPAPEDLDVHKYVTEINSDGIWVTPSSKKPTNTSTGAGATGTKIDGTGIGIYVSGTKLAQYGTTTYFYEPDGTTAATLDGTGLNIKTGTINLGSNFSVTSGGILTATGATISGGIIATSFEANNNGANPKTVLESSGLTMYDSNGYRKARFSNTISLWGGNSIIADTSTYPRVDIGSNEISIASSDTYKTILSSTGMSIFSGDASDASAVFGSTTIIGKTSQSHIQLTSNDFIFYDDTGISFFNLTKSTSPPSYTTTTLSITTSDESGTETVYMNSTQLTNYNNGKTKISLSYSRRVVDAVIDSINTSTGAIVVSYTSLDESTGISINVILKTVTGDTTISTGLTFGSRSGNIGSNSVVLGSNSVAAGDLTSALGVGLIANGFNETVIGRYNKSSNTTAQTSYNTTNSPYILVVGNGTSSSARSNALTLDWSGNLVAKGEINGTLGTFTSGVNISDGQAYKINNVNILELVYPVGAIYISTSSTSPATLFGGEWTRITGQFLLGATDNGTSGTTIKSNASVAAGSSGGEASHTLTSSESGLPAHSHGTRVTYEKTAGSGTARYHIASSGDTSTNGNFVSTVDNTAANASSAHNNMPPFLAVYMWKRTA